MPDFTWDEAARNFRDARTGRFEPRAAVERAVGAVADAAAADARALTARLAAGGIDLAGWQRGMAGLIRRAHLAAATVARGGRARMGHEQLGAVGPGLRAQYAHLRDFARELADGLPVGGRVLARAESYAHSAWGVYHGAFDRDQRVAGYTQKRRVLAGAAKHCDDCRAEAGRGWVAVDHPRPLRPIGDSECSSRCRCRLEHRRRRRPPS